MAILPYFGILISITENIPYIIAGDALLLALVKKNLRKYVLAAPLVFLATVIAVLMVESHIELGDHKNMNTAIKTYIDAGEGDITHILESGEYKPVVGPRELSRLAFEFLPATFAHNEGSDNTRDVPVAYNKGDDWFEATLGEPMVYTSAIYLGKDESMWQGQLRKIQTIIASTGVKPGDKVLDIGCGWGRLLEHYAKAGAHATGLTLSKDQAAYGRKVTAAHKANVDIRLENFFDVGFEEKSFNVISAVEMAEHVGIRNYQHFLKKVHSLLRDDGTFYIQVAGLRPGTGDYTPFEEIVWGLFMDEHVFPGADASCPMSWVITHLERAGFEVQRSLNMGVHYSQTLDHWSQEWVKNEKAITEKHGARSYRRWDVFLKWSTRIARIGGSSVFMIVATKAGQTAARIASQERVAAQLSYDHVYEV